jgi:hypothetical protein
MGYFQTSALFDENHRRAILRLNDLTDGMETAFRY